MPSDETLIPEPSGLDEHIATEELASFLNGGMVAAERSRIQAHLAECSECRGELVEITKIESRVASGRRWRTAVPLVAAAGLAAVLLAGPLVRQAGDRTPAEETVPAVPEGVRRAPEAAAEREGVRRFPAIQPRDGSELNGRPSFEWGVAGGEGTVYRLTITDTGGAPLWSEETSETSLLPPPQLQLEPGRTYLWYVDALLADGTAATTGVLQFRVSP